jgi:hypothetical protein
MKAVEDDLQHSIKEEKLCINAKSRKVGDRLSQIASPGELLLALNYLYT